MHLLRILIIAMSLLLAAFADDCGGEDDDCSTAKECDAVCGLCVAACLPTGEGGAGQCHCSCGK